MLASFSDQLAIRLSQGTLACKLVHNRKGKLDEVAGRIAEHQADPYALADALAGQLAE